VVAELDYRPNVAARTLRKSASYLIGYSWTPQPPDRANAILDQFLTSTAEAAETAGYHLLLFPSHKATDQTATYRDLVHSGRVDGFILTTTNYDDPRIPLLQALRFPFVAFGRANPEWDFAYVDVDGRAGVCAATEHLIQQGHQRIALLTWPEGSRVGTARENGYYELGRKGHASARRAKMGITKRCRKPVCRLMPIGCGAVPVILKPACAAPRRYCNYPKVNGPPQSSRLMIT
jgi:DNA-binding LacI/PurR family transcriptional regulator